MKTAADFPPHSTFDNIAGLITGITLSAMGIATLGSSGLITGGAAGMALLLSYVAPYSPAQLVPMINLPFILFSVFTMGRAFAGKTLVVSLVLGYAVHACGLMLLPHVNPITGGIAGAVLLGMGVLAFARHSASIGGTGIVCLWLYKVKRWNAGRCQMVFDLALFAVAAFVQPWHTLLISLFSTAIMNSMLMLWHREGRYRG